MSARPRAPAEIIDPAYYASHGYPHEQWTELRARAPIAWCEADFTVPFWAVTRHDDIVEISKQPNVFENAPRLLVGPNSAPPEGEQALIRTLLNMDPPEHREYRKLVSRYFTKRRLSEDQARLDRVADELVQSVRDKDEFDFVTEISAILPLAVIAELMGVPQADRPQYFRWTNEIIGALDPEFARDGLSGNELAQTAIMEFMQYSQDIVEDRRKHPTDDLTSVIANARLNGDYLPPLELLSYIVLLIVAGNETTRNAASGGLLAFMQNPDQLARARANPDLLNDAVEEIVRWTSPVIHFARTANRDVSVGGMQIRAGEHMALFYPSANRDESRYRDPFTFDISRQNNLHLGYGNGEHLCLGAHLARVELRAIFRALFARMEHVEQVGEAERIPSVLVGGVKHLPVRLRLAA